MKIKPKEIKTLKYWLHILVIAVIVLGILQLWLKGQMFNLTNILISAGLIGGSDIISHTLIGID